MRRGFCRRARDRTARTVRPGLLRLPVPLRQLRHQRLLVRAVRLRLRLPRGRGRLRRRRPGRLRRGRRPGGVLRPHSGRLPLGQPDHDPSRQRRRQRGDHPLRTPFRRPPGQRRADRLQRTADRIHRSVVHPGQRQLVRPPPLRDQDRPVRRAGRIVRVRRPGLPLQLRLVRPPQQLRPRPADRAGPVRLSDRRRGRQRRPRPERRILRGGPPAEHRHHHLAEERFGPHAPGYHPGPGPRLRVLERTDRQRLGGAFADRPARRHGAGPGRDVPGDLLEQVRPPGNLLRALRPGDRRPALAAGQGHLVAADRPAADVPRPMGRPERVRRRLLERPDQHRQRPKSALPHSGQEDEREVLHQERRRHRLEFVRVEPGPTRDLEPARPRQRRGHRRRQLDSAVGELAALHPTLEHRRTAELERYDHVH